jgi:DNA-directed RNA polymerase subunit RPC12/RpoP
MADRTDRDEEIAALRADLDTLRGLVTSLSDDLRRAHQSVDLTMRGQLRCRGCSGRRIAHAPKVLDRADGNTREGMALYQPSFWSAKTQGQLEAYVCMTCGLVEWWVGDPGSLKPHPEFLIVHDGEAEGGKDPYR